MSREKVWRVDHGDCLPLMAAMPPASVDAIVTDPPYGLGFMGKAWDALPPGIKWAEACLRVLKPGGYMLAFGGTRTYHRLACAVEDGGFEIRDQIQWLYGSGFPKGKACLKPAHEPIVLARKPAPRVTPLNVDGCRVEHDETLSGGTGTKGKHEGWDRPWMHDDTSREGYRSTAGRWPANVLLDEEAASILDAQTGTLTTHPGTMRTDSAPGGFMGLPRRAAETVLSHGDSGGASRFYYCAKASTRERNAGLDGFEPASGGTSVGGFASGDLHAANVTRKDGGPSERRPMRNTHATVKPVSLMRWLVRLITPEGGTVLDPMCGSGTTGIASRLEGFGFVGIEREAEYVDIARARIAHWEPEPALFAA